MGTKGFDKLLEDIRATARHLRVAYRRHFRDKDNEWIIEEMMEHCDHCRCAAHASMAAGNISKWEYQQLVSAPLEEWNILLGEVREHEKRNND